MLRGIFGSARKRPLDSLAADRRVTQQIFPLLAETPVPAAELSLDQEGGINGDCPVCGKAARFSGFTSNFRESGTCSSCHSSNRQRQMAFSLRWRLGLPIEGALRLPSKLALYNTEAAGPVHNVLKGHAHYFCSEYFGDEHVSGALVNGIRHEDLQQLSFADQTLDIVMSSDVLEHMPDPYQAHREILRVLKPGGRHLFTVPFMPNTVDDDIRARLDNGEISYFGEKLFHGDPVRPGEGVLVWTIFGIEMLLKLQQMGYQVRAWNLFEPEHGIIGDGAIVFEAMRPA